MITRDLLLKPKKKLITIWVEEWQADCHLSPLSLRDLFHLEQARPDSAGNPDERTKVIAEVLVRSIVDSDGNRLLKDDDAPALVANQPGEVLARLFKALGEGSAPRPEDGEKNCVTAT